MQANVVSGCLVVLVLGCLLPATWGAEPNARPIEKLETLLHGDWDGLGPCDGEFTYGSDGTFKARYVGPAGESFSGTWDIVWNALPPTLVRHTKAAEDSDGIGRTSRWKILELNTKSLVLAHDPKSEYDRSIRYERFDSDHGRQLR